MTRPSPAKLFEIAVFAVLVAGTGWLGKLVHHNYVEHGQAATVESLPSAPAVIPARDAGGSDAPIRVDGSRSKLALLLSVDCPFCEQNMPQWVRLAAAVNALGDRAPSIVVLSLSSVAETEAYMATHGLTAEVRYVDRGILPLVGVSGYPTTLAMDPTTRDLRAWSGVLRSGDLDAIEAWAGSQIRASASAGIP